VLGGQVILINAASVVQVGLPYTVQFKNLPPEIPTTSGSSQTLIKRVNKIILRLRDTLGVQIGKDAANLRELQFRHVADLMGKPPSLFTGDYEVDYPGEYEKTGQFILQQNKPAPFTLQTIIMELSVSG